MASTVMRWFLLTQIKSSLSIDSIPEEESNLTANFQFLVVYYLNSSGSCHCHQSQFQVSIIFESRDYLDHCRYILKYNIRWVVSSDLLSQLVRILLLSPISVPSINHERYVRKYIKNTQSLEFAYDSSVNSSFTASIQSPVAPNVLFLADANWVTQNWSVSKPYITSFL